MLTALFKPFDLFLLLLCFFLIGACSERKAPPKAVKGVLDLRDWDFGSSQDSGSDGIVKLDGEWEFYWKELPTAGEGGVLQLPEGKKDFIQVPNNWNGYQVKDIENTNIKITDGNGYASYRLKVLLPDQNPISLRVPSMGTAYKLFIDNNFRLEGGTVGSTEQESIPFRGTKYITFVPTSDHLLLTLVISNFHLTNGGQLNSIGYGNVDAMNKYHMSRLSLDFFVTGILFIMGVYHLSLFHLRREDKSALYFGILCLLLSLKTLIGGEVYLKEIIPSLNYSLGLTINYTTFYLGLPIFNQFITILYPMEINSIFQKIINGICLFLVTYVIIFPPLYFSSSLLYYEIVLFIFVIYSMYIFIRAILNNREGAKTILIGFFFFGATIVNDILHDNNVINTGLYASYGLVIFIFSQSFLLTSRFANAFHQVKDLSLNLEKKVEDRTSDLELQKQKIEAAYVELQTTQSQLIEAERMASLGQLVGGIAHEINNPIAVIHSHAELLEANQNSTLKEIPLFLSSLETKEINLFYEIVDISIKNRIFLNSKEERKQKKEVQKDLLEIVKDERLCITLSDSLVLLRLPPPYEKYIEEVGAEKLAKFLTMAEVFKNQSNSLSSIEIAVEKASRVVFALRSYLNTQLFSEKKEIDLVTELEKALHVYDNYVMGKINVRKEFPQNLSYNCVSENLLQVWKNLFFNAVQAMYNTDKKLEIRLERVEKLPDSLKLYRTSSIVEESIFQKTDAKNWIVVSITDSGVGIPSDLQEKVFTPFFTTKSLGEGIGLGLYTCKKIVHEHGGALFFKSEEGSTEFVVVLPFIF